MIAGIVAFASLAAVADGFAVVSPCRSQMGTLSDAGTVSSNKATFRNRPRSHIVNTKMSLATGAGSGTATPTQKEVYNQESWALVSNAHLQRCRSRGLSW